MLNLFSKKQLSPEAREYYELCGKTLPGSTPVSEASFVVLDIETTGFQIGKDKMLSIAYLPVTTESIRPSQMKNMLFYRKQGIINEAVKIHGILPSDTLEGTEEADIVRTLLQDLAGKIIVGHHIHFDAGMLNEAFYRIFGAKLKNQLIDTALMATKEIEAFHKTGYANQRPPLLDDICRHLGISMRDRHTAAGDTYITSELFIYLCAKRKNRLQHPLTLGELQPSILK